MNAIFTKRDGEHVCLHFGNERFWVLKWKDGGTYLYVGDHYTAKSFSCCENMVCGRLVAISEKMVEIELTGKRRAKVLYSYQTSCLPWLASILFPGKNLLV